MKSRAGNPEALLSNSRTMLKLTREKLRAYTPKRDDRMRMGLRTLASGLWLATADLAQHVLAAHGLAPFSGDEERDLRRARRAASTPAERDAVRLATELCEPLYQRLFLGDDDALSIEDVKAALPEIEEALRVLEDER